MPKKPRANPDYVKFDNDSKQKKLTKKHKLQKLEYMKRSYKQSVEWHQRRQKDLDQDLLEINQLELEIEQMG